MKKIKIKFTDFWGGFDIYDNYFYNLLKKRFDLEISNAPDLLIYSNYGRENLKYNCFKIFYSSENVRPDFNLCDFSFSFDYGNHPKNYRLPLYALYDDVNKLITSNDKSINQKKKLKFCNFIYSNPKAKERIDFFNALSKYKKVDSAGKLFNNIGHAIGRMPGDKLTFISQYKFTIAFENASHHGYTTEKIFQPMLVNSIPIYWGNPLIDLEFNSKSFINAMKFASHDELIERIIQIDSDDDLYEQYLTESYFINNKVPDSLQDDTILNQFDYILASLDGKPVSKTIKGMVYKNITAIRPYFRKIYRKVT